MEAAALESGLASGSSAMLGWAAPCSCRPSSLLPTSCAGVTLRHQRPSAQPSKGNAIAILASCNLLVRHPDCCASGVLQAPRSAADCRRHKCQRVARGAHPEDEEGTLALWAAGLLLADSTASSGEGVSNRKPPSCCCAPCRAMGKVSLPKADCCGGLTARCHNPIMHACRDASAGSLVSRTGTMPPHLSSPACLCLMAPEG